LHTKAFRIWSGIHLKRRRTNYYLRKAKEIPFMDPRNPRYRLAIAAWRRLPLAATRALGPRLITGLV